MATVKDVAREANVSVGTVSKVLSKDQTVGHDLRDRVLLAIKTLNYKPNIAARALRTSVIDMLGLIVPDITNPFFSQLAKSIEAEAAKSAHTVMLANSDEDPDKEAHHVQALLEQFPRGLIIVGSVHQLTREIMTHVPIVSVDRRYGAYQLIATNHEAAASMVAGHLFGLGHRRIAYIAGPQSSEVGRLRKKGFCDGLAKLASPNVPISLTTREGQFNYRSGESIAYELIGDRKSLHFTAIAAASDQQAIGALRAAGDLGVSVPHQISITGFDDIALASLVTPRLTTIAQPTADLAVSAVRSLLGRPLAPPGDVLIDAHLKIRESTGPAHS